jgi:hypothetical protein
VERSDSKKAQSVSSCDGKWPCFLVGKRKKRSPNGIKDKVQPEEKKAQDDIQLLGSHFVPLGTFREGDEVEEDSSEEDSPESPSFKQVPQWKEGQHFKPHEEEKEKGPGCNCDWPCLPFFDSINRCYNKFGDLLLDSNGQPIILPRRFSNTQKKLVLCLSYLEKDEIDCFIKPS